VPGIVDRAVQAAECVESHAYHVLHIVRLRHIGTYKNCLAAGFSDDPHGFCAVLGRPGGDHNLGPLCGEGLRTSSPEPAAEDAPINPVNHVSWRPDHEQLVLSANNDHLRSIVVRPGVVYGGGSGIVADLFKSASNGLVRVVGDGNNHWPLVYDRDLADLYARLAGREDTAGIYHANDEGDERVNEIVSAIKPYLPVKPDVRHVPLEEARSKMGTYAEALALDQLVRSPRARALGWTPTLHSVAGNAARLLEEWRAAQN